jgi:tRNA nucleotidyltransferase/poly(A) polymerase
MKFKSWLLKEEESASMTADIPMPSEILMLNNLFKKYRKKMFAVGGAVRDYLINIHHTPHLPYSPKDVDLTTDATTEEIINILSSPEARELGIRPLPKGEAFGVISAIINGQEFEIATFREDIYEPTSDGRRPERIQHSTAAKDAQRRDLTMNALFYDIDKKEIHDFNVQNGRGQGLEDIKNLTARPVGDPEQRFKEDKLRILRLIRFFSRFNPNKILDHIDPETLSAVHNHKALEGISGERISMEFINGFKSAANKTNFLHNFQDLDLVPTLFPSLRVDLSGYQDTKSLTATLAYILRQNEAATARNTLNNSKYPNEITDKVEFLLNTQNIQSRNIIPLIKKKNILKAATDVKEFGKLIGDRLLQKFAQYEQQTKSTDFTHLKGPEISKAMNQKEMEFFLKA